MKKKNRFLAALLFSILLLTAGCANSAKNPDTKTVPTTVSQKDDAAAAKQTEAISADASLNSIRQAMVETPQLFAVAYFGYHETLDSALPVDPFAVMEETAPQLCKDLPFLLDIPKERIVGESGDLFCIVPLDEDAIVAVNKGTWKV